MKCVFYVGILGESVDYVLRLGSWEGDYVFKVGIMGGSVEVGLCC